MKYEKLKSGVWKHFKQHTIQGVKYGSCLDEKCPSKTQKKKRRSEIEVGGVALIQCTGSNMSNLWYHLETFHPDVHKEIECKDKKKIEKQQKELAKFQKAPKQETVAMFSPKPGPKFKKSHPSKKSFNQDFEDLLVNEGLPFRLASSQYFRKMVYHLEPRVVVNHPTTYLLRL